MYFKEVTIHEDGGAGAPHPALVAKCECNERNTWHVFQLAGQAHFHLQCAFCGVSHCPFGLECGRPIIAEHEKYRVRPVTVRDIRSESGFIVAATASDEFICECATTERAETIAGLLNRVADLRCEKIDEET